jgi:hypothetical protein
LEKKLELTTYESELYAPPTHGTAEQNARLAKLETNFFESVVDMMTSLREISDAELYRCRAFESMKDYMRDYLAKSSPFALSFSTSLLALSYKVESSESLRSLDVSRIRELGKIANENDVVAIDSEGIVRLEDGREFTVTEYKAELTKQLKKEILSKSERSKEKAKIQELGDQLSESTATIATLRDQLANARIEQELAESLNHVKADDLGKFLTKAGARRLFSEEGQRIESSLLIFAGSVNTIEDRIKGEEEITQAVEDFIRSLDSAKQRILNVWSPFIRYTDEKAQALLTDLDQVAIEDNTLTVKDEIRNLFGYLDSEGDKSPEDIYSKVEDIQIALNALDESDFNPEFVSHVRGLLNDLTPENLNALREVL